MTDYIKLPTGLAEAEQFLDHYGIPYEPVMLEGKRIPLMLRFRFYLEAVELEGRITAASQLKEHEDAIKWSLERAFKDVGAHEEANKPVGSWSAGCLNTSACGSCKSTCSS